MKRISPEMLPNTHGGLQILVVEDETLIAMCMEDILTELGCQVVTAGRVAQGLRVIDSRHFDGAFLDIDVSGTSILPIAESLRSRGIPFAFVTGHDRGQVPVGFRDRPVLSKPLVDDRFAEVVANFALARTVELAAHARATKEYSCRPRTHLNPC